jgi:IS30 family transposase
MLLRLQFPNREQIERVIHEIFQREPVAQWHGSLVIVSERNCVLSDQKSRTTQRTVNGLD